jgi:hypothetical protein
MADRPDYRAFGESSASDAYATPGPASPDELPRSRGVLEKPPAGAIEIPDVPVPRTVPVPNFILHGLSKNPRVGANYETPLLGGVLNMGATVSPLAPLSGNKFDPSFSARYTRQF